MWKETLAFNNANSSIINKEMMEGSDIMSNHKVS